MRIREREMRGKEKTSVLFLQGEQEEAYVLFNPSDLSSEKKALKTEIYKKFDFQEQKSCASTCDLTRAQSEKKHRKI